MSRATTMTSESNLGLLSLKKFNPSEIVVIGPILNYLRCKVSFNSEFWNIYHVPVNILPTFQEVDVILKDTLDLIPGAVDFVYDMDAKNIVYVSYMENGALYYTTLTDTITLSEMSIGKIASVYEDINSYLVVEKGVLSIISCVDKLLLKFYVSFNYFHTDENVPNASYDALNILNGFSTKKLGVTRYCSPASSLVPRLFKMSIPVSMKDKKINVNVLKDFIKRKEVEVRKEITNFPPISFVDLTTKGIPNESYTPVSDKHLILGENNESLAPFINQIYTTFGKLYLVLNGEVVDSSAKMSRDAFTEYIAYVFEKFYELQITAINYK
jgi:hypothetical protein